MINVNMTEKAGVTLATAGKYCADNVKVTPSAEILRKDEQTKTATPTETAQDITPDSGKVLSKVSVGAIPKTYVGSGVTKKAAATVSPSTSEQTVCASGVYTTGEQKVSAITPSIVGNLDASSFAASIVAAIEGKGVTVPDGTRLDGMASLIESIEAGGGGSFDLSNFMQNITDVISFSFTPTRDGDGYSIRKPSTNSIPRMGFVYADDISYAYNKSILCFWLYTAVDPYTDVSSGANLQVHFYTNDSSYIVPRTNNKFLLQNANQNGCLSSSRNYAYIGIKSQTTSNNKAIFKAGVQYKGFVLFGD